MEITKTQKQYPDDVKIQAVKMVRDSSTINGVARLIGVNRVTVKKWVNKYGVGTKTPKSTLDHGRERDKSSTPAIYTALPKEFSEILVELQSIAAQLRSNSENLIDRRSSIWLFIGITCTWSLCLLILFLFSTF